MSKKFIFIAIIVIFALSMSIPFASIFSSSPKNPTPIDSQNNEAQGIEGVIRKMENGQFPKGTHILEIGGISLAALESGKGVNLDKYIGKDVRIFGTPQALTGSDGIFITVSKVEEVTE